MGLEEVGAVTYQRPHVQEGGVETSLPSDQWAIDAKGGHGIYAIPRDHVITVRVVTRSIIL